MEINKEYRKILVSELRQVAKMIDKEDNIERKIFFLSGADSMAQTILNIDFDPELVCVFSILNSSYNMISEVFENIQNDEGSIVKIPENFFSEVSHSIEDLAKAIEENKDIYKVLQKINLLTYSLTPNGYYKYSKDAMKL